MLYGDVGFDVVCGDVCSAVSLSSGSNAVFVVVHEVAFLLVVVIVDGDVGFDVVGGNVSGAVSSGSNAVFVVDHEVAFLFVVVSWCW